MVTEHIGKKYHSYLVHGVLTRESLLLLKKYEDAGESWDKVRRYVLDGNLLGKKSVRRAEHILESVRRRFLIDSELLPPPRLIARFGAISFPETVKKQVVLAYISVSDDLFHDVFAGLFATHDAPSRTFT